MKKIKQKAVTKITEAELESFRGHARQNNALLQFMGIVNEREACLWERIRKKYNLRIDKKHTVNFTTGEIFEA